jgi:hypothetical protein
VPVVNEDEVEMHSYYTLGQLAALRRDDLITEAPGPGGSEPRGPAGPPRRGRVSVDD